MNIGCVLFKTIYLGCGDFAVGNPLIWPPFFLVYKYDKISKLDSHDSIRLFHIVFPFREVS